MALQAPRIRSWRFQRAPARLQALFPEGRVTDWLAIIPESIATFTEAPFLRWRQLHPVSTVRLADGSIVYWGAVSESIYSIAERPPGTEGNAPAIERRSGVRLSLACAAWYEAGPPARTKTGVSQLINMSNSGVSFTTEAKLRKGARAGLRIAWPVRLEGNLPVELAVAGKLVRTDAAQAALQYDRLAFNIAAT